MSRLEGFQGDRVGLGSAAPTGVQAIDRGDLVGRQLEVEHVDVLCDAAGLGRLRDDRAAVLQTPTQHHLGRGLGVGVSDVCDDGVVEGAAVAAAAIEGDAADRRPRLREDPALGAEVLHLALLEVGVALDLVDRRHHRGASEQRR